MKNQDIDQLFTMWEQHDARVEQIAHKAMPVSQRRKEHALWWRYGAAAAVVAIMVTTVLLWPQRQEPIPSDTLLAANRETIPATTTPMPCDIQGERVSHTHKAALLSLPQVEKPAVVAQPIPAEPTPHEETVEPDLIGIPADETFQSAFVEDGHHQTYVRCNSLCDAHDIINKTQEAL